MKLSVLIAFFALASAAVLPAEEQKFEWRKEPNAAWWPGEKLNYNVKWQFITVGYAILEVRPPEEMNGRKAYHIYSEAKSAPFFDNFYKVRNTNETWIDTESLCSLKFVTNINEGKAVKTETLNLDQENKTFLMVESKKTGPIPLWVQDVLSSLYYLRTKELVVGQVYSFQAHSGDLTWPLNAKVVKREKVKVPAGEYDCFVVEPTICDGAGIFRAKGKLWVWFTADNRKTPVKMSSKIPIGSIEAVLVNR